jgi:hypothetical protein
MLKTIGYNAIKVSLDTKVVRDQGGGFTRLLPQRGTRGTSIVWAKRSANRKARESQINKKTNGGENAFRGVGEGISLDVDLPGFTLANIWPSM